MNGAPGAWDKWLTQYTTPRLFSETTLNNRFQVAELNASDTACHTYVNKAYGYGSQNNGNVLSIVNNNDVDRTQNFTYDTLNRIQSAYTQGTTGQTAWGDNFTIDAWGNMSSTQMSTRPNGDTIPSVYLTNWDGHNRMNSPSVQYDPAGNLTNDGTYSFTYDADNMLKSDQNYTYLYDSSGMRFQKWQNGAGVKGYVYGSGSEPLVEASGSGSITAEYVYLNGKRIARIDPDHSVHYYLSDHLGSTSTVVSAASGNVEEESDFRPYGFEVAITGPGSNRYKFTGKERDSESGNDYFSARYYASAMGRFMSPDPDDGPRPTNNPQRLNLYTYALNNPLRFIDEDGFTAVDRVNRATSLIGKPYGHNDQPNSYDCSGLAQYSVGSDLSKFPGTAATQYTYASANGAFTTDTSQVQAGDEVFFQNANGTVVHVGVVQSVDPKTGLLL